MTSGTIRSVTRDRTPAHPPVRRRRALVVTQLAMPSYRQEFVRALERSGADILLLVGDAQFGDGVVTDVASPIVVRTGRDSQILDVDEYIEAVAAGVLDRAAAERALTTSYRAVAGLHAHGHHLDQWLLSLGLTLTWRRR